ncbi:hypothetical protein ABZW30_12600 [Kitasatospora sp. NPDC004669]|uniref:hypothetical protein n=1 Tax=Kitasatospora sp. NPDC004669 TaxID=3154555 RepID=UPI0033BB2587
MNILTALFGRRTTTDDPRVRHLQIELADAHQQNVKLSARLVSTTRRADRAEEALDQMRVASRKGHDELLRLFKQQQREMAQLRKDRDGALAQLDNALGYDEKTLATINAGGIGKAAA